MRNAGRVNAVYRFFKSVRLAVVLIIVLAVLSLLATLVPQGRPDAWYQARYAPALSAVVRLLHLGSFFSSALFLVPVLLFSMNLGVCAADRLIARAKRRAPRRYGPDLVHIGLLVLIAAGLVTVLGRQESTWSLAEGEEAAIGSGYTVRLLSFQHLKYDDGSPREWISTVRVARGGQQVLASFPIEVNHPLRLKGITLYQSTWDVTGTLRMRDGDGNDIAPPAPGDYFEEGDSRWVFSGFAQSPQGWGAAFQRYRGLQRAETRLLRPGDSVGPFIVTEISAREITGLKAVRDPGVAPFLAALVLLTAGLCLTFIQQRGDSTP